MNDGFEDRLGHEDAPPPRRGAASVGDRSRQTSGERYSDEREASDRGMADDREMTEDERFEMFALSQFQSILPDLPRIPGHHTFWATTTNGRDSVQQRIRMGYTPITVEECPGWSGTQESVGNQQNVVSVNEMIGMKIPLSLYHRYMKLTHHDRPLEEEEKLRHNVERMKADAESYGSILEEGDGSVEEFARNARRPSPNFGH